MLRIYRYLLIAVLTFTVAACGAQAIPTFVPTVTDVPPTNTVVISSTPIPTDTVSATTTPLATETPRAPTISPLLTSIPGIALTMTQVYLTPGAEDTLVAQQTMMAATVGAQLNGFSDTLLKQCPDPSDPPVQKWVDIPVMPQATAGQKVDTLIGSYYCFRAPVTGADVESFYKEKLTSPGWSLQADANSVMQFFGLSEKGIQMLFIVYEPSNKNDLLVAINVTVPFSIPTVKP